MTAANHIGYCIVDKVATNTKRKNEIATKIKCQAINTTTLKDQNQNIGKLKSLMKNS